MVNALLDFILETYLFDLPERPNYRILIQKKNGEKKLEFIFALDEWLR